jgi:sulfur relay (sulfurtransferase) complex TusBCD TusD component (DsrE family)
LDVCLVSDQDQVYETQVKNDPKGFEQLHHWMTEHTPPQAAIKVCLEATGIYSDAVALFCYETGYTTGGHFAYPREIQLANLRIDLEAAIVRGMKRLCATQRRDMPKLISDLLEGYTLDETCERHQWTRNRGVTLMRKLRAIFYEEMSGERRPATWAATTRSSKPRNSASANCTQLD